MKITDDNWFLTCENRLAKDRAVIYSKNAGVKWASGHESDSDLTLCFCADLENLCARNRNNVESHARPITETRFMQMCDEYAAENQPEPREVKFQCFGSTKDIVFFNGSDKLISQSGLNNGEFYCLLEGGTTPPRITHATYKAAKVEARRLVEAHGKPVRILRAMLEIKPAGRYIETEL